MIRQDLPDVVYKTEQGKFNAVIDDIVEHHEKGQPDVYKRQAWLFVRRFCGPSCTPPTKPTPWPVPQR